jgi:hypothetical protein
MKTRKTNNATKQSRAPKQARRSMQRMARPLRKSVCADYALHLEAAMQTGELSNGTDVRYLTDLLDAVMQDCKWPSA